MLIKIAVALFISFLLCILFTPLLKNKILQKNAGQNILHYVVEHKSKQGTATMGGLAFVFCSAVVFLLCKRGQSSLALISLFAMLAFAFVGFLDDILKVKHKNNLGLKAWQKMVLLLIVSCVLSASIYLNPLVKGAFLIPFSNNYLNFGVFTVIVFIFIYISTTNAVNLTDGLDGLASAVSLAFLFGLCLLLEMQIYKAGQNGETLAYVAELNNLLVLCTSFFGALFAFYIFNANKASIFMGDVGSLAIGGLLASVCFCTHLGFYLLIYGVVFVWTTISVIIQVLHFKRTKKRVFLMAPYHHHLQKKGLSESKIVAIYFGTTFFVVALSLLIDFLVVIK